MYIQTIILLHQAMQLHLTDEDDDDSAPKHIGTDRKRCKSLAFRQYFKW